MATHVARIDEMKNESEAFVRQPGRKSHPCNIGMSEMIILKG
jgi:hypothetical protein